MGKRNHLLKNITKLLAKLVARFPNLWDSYLPFVQYQYNNAIQDSTHVAPYTVLFGHLPRVVSLAPPVASLVRPLTPAIEHCVVGFSKIREMVEGYLEEAKRRQAEQYDRYHMEVTYNLGDLVLYRDVAVRTSGMKLSPRYRGPYQVTRQINPVAYLLTDLDTGETFSAHVEKLKKFFGNKVGSQEVQLNDEGNQTRDEGELLIYDHENPNFDVVPPLRLQREAHGDRWQVQQPRQEDLPVIIQPEQLPDRPVDAVIPLHEPTAAVRGARAGRRRLVTEEALAASQEYRERLRSGPS